MCVVVVWGEIAVVEDERKKMPFDSLDLSDCDDRTRERGGERIP
jgi:hypothetical protein